jgi:hypothetical protein
VSWPVEVTEEYAEWFRALLEEHLESATQVAQAVGALRRPHAADARQRAVDGNSGLSGRGAALIPRPADFPPALPPLEPRVRAHPQTSSAVSTISRSLATCSS